MWWHCKNGTTVTLLFTCIQHVSSSFLSQLLRSNWWTEPSISTDLRPEMSTTMCVKSNPRSTSMSADMTGEVASWRCSWFAEPPFLFHVLNPTFQILGSSLCREIASQFCQRLELPVRRAECHISSNLSSGNPWSASFDHHTSRLPVAARYKR